MQREGARISLGSSALVETFRLVGILILSWEIGVRAGQRASSLPIDSCYTGIRSLKRIASIQEREKAAIKEIVRQKFQSTLTGPLGPRSNTSPQATTLHDIESQPLAAGIAYM